MLPGGPPHHGRQRSTPPTARWPSAGAGRSVTVLLADDIDISRGDLLAAADAAAAGDRRARRHPVLAGRQAAAPRRPAAAQARHPHHPGDRRGDRRAARPGHDHASVEAPGQLQINDIAPRGLRTADPLPVDDYADVRATGSFLLIDPPTGNTLAAGLVGYPLADALG